MGAHVVTLPPGVMLGAIVRDGEMICPRGSTVVQAKDKVVFFATEDVIRQVEMLRELGARNQKQIGLDHDPTDDPRLGTPDDAGSEAAE